MSFDTHPDLVVQPYLNGVRLVKPKNDFNLFPNIGSLFTMPLMIYFVDFEATFIDGNHFTCLTNIPGNKGYYSDKDLKNTPLNKLFKKETVELFTHHNNNILTRKRLTVYEELSLRLDEVTFAGISFKFPVFGLDDKIMGIFGISALTTKSIFKEAEDFSDSMERIYQTRLIPCYRNLLSGFSLEGMYFTKQEIRCLRLLVAGKTMKLIRSTFGTFPTNCRALYREYKTEIKCYKQI